MAKRKPRKPKTPKPAAAKKKPSTENVDKLRLYLTSKVEGQYEVKPEHRFHETRRWRFDMAISELMLAIEYEGGCGGKSRHTSFSGYSLDCEKYSTAAAMGWRVLRFVHKQVNSGECFAIIDLALQRLTGGDCDSVRQP